MRASLKTRLAKLEGRRRRPGVTIWDVIAGVARTDEMPAGEERDWLEEALRSHPTIEQVLADCPVEGFLAGGWRHAASEG
jgi:hypothetical protein